MSAEVPPVVHLADWTESVADLLRPPVNNAMVWPTGDDLLVQVVGGPNSRDDFHVDPYEEFFFQLKGNMHVEVMTPAGRRTVHIREGQVWVLPRNLPHSPQRPEAGSIGLVVERVRPEGVTERFQWYCPSCDALVHEVEVQVRDLVVDLPAAFAEAEGRKRLCPSCDADPGDPSDPEVIEP
jgi:3-hydroxyanthranilate 3,4-dioxygenase